MRDKVLPGKHRDRIIVNGGKYLMSKCSKKRVIAHLIGQEDKPILLNAFYHPATCHGIRYSHIDVILPEDYCGLKTYFQYGGGSIPFHYYNGLLLVNIGRVMGYPCILEVDLSDLSSFDTKIIKLEGFTYIRLSRGGNLYIRIPS